MDKVNWVKVVGAAVGGTLLIGAIATLVADPTIATTDLAHDYRLWRNNGVWCADQNTDGSIKLLYGNDCKVDFSTGQPPAKVR